MNSGVEVIREVLVRGPIARSELSSVLGLSAPSLTRIARPYIESGLLIELEESRDGSMGRPTRPLVVSPDIGRVIGVKITGDHVHLALTDMRAHEVAAADAPIESSKPEDVAQQIARLVRGLADRSEHPILHVGVCLGGSVSDDGRVLRAPFLGWRGVALGGMLEEAIGLPVTLENDVVALAKAEYLVGAARGIPNFSLITIGVGIGYGLVLHGQAVKSADTGLGLGGHVTVDPSGPFCPYGHRGCARAMLSIDSLCGQARVALGRDVSYQELLTLAAEGHVVARAIVEAAATALGRLIFLSTSLIMHPTVVLSGDGIGLWDVAEETVRAAATAQRDPDASPLDIIVDKSGFEAWARGAAAVAIEHSLAQLAL
ncbi:MAG: ROK family protein [Ancrocorticia sp.]